MDSSDRQEFERQMSVLCAGFGVPVGDRVEAYWRAFNRLALVEFSRVVDYAISPDSDLEKMPTVKQLWLSRKQMRRVSHKPEPNGKNVALCEYVMRHFRLSPGQRAGRWSFIARSKPEPTKEHPDRLVYDMIGLIVAQDEKEPEKFPAIRVLFAEVNWQQYLEAA